MDVETAAAGGACAPEDAAAATAAAREEEEEETAAGGRGDTAEGESSETAQLATRKRRKSSSSSRYMSKEKARGAAGSSSSSSPTAATAAAAEDSDAEDWVYEDSFEDEYEEEEDLSSREGTAVSSSSETEEEESATEDEEATMTTAAAAVSEAETTQAATAAATDTEDEEETRATETTLTEETATTISSSGAQTKTKKNTSLTAAVAEEESNTSSVDPRQTSKIPTKKKHNKRREETETEEKRKKQQQQHQIWRPGVDPLAEGEELACDMKSYDVFHRMTVDWSCLSFDILPNKEQSSKAPYHCYVVSGTQAEISSRNKIFTMKWSNLQKTKYDNSSSSEEEEEESSEEEGENDDDPSLDFRLLSHNGTVNRLRACPQLRRLIATWADTGDVCVWDIAKQLQRLDDPGAPGAPPSPHQAPKFKHRSRSGAEGFAMDWNRMHVGRMLTGDVRGGVHLWMPVEAGWSVACIAEAACSSSSRKKKHLHSSSNSSNSNSNSSNSSSSNRNNSSSSNGSSSNSSSSGELRFIGVSEGATVEEVQWKVVGDGAGDVFATASSDGSIRVYDCREKISRDQSALLLLHAHPCDVNALRWSPLQGNLLLSGDEEGCVKVWDQRYGETPLALFRWHKKPVTSVDWHPADEAVFASAALDDTIAFWDLSVEAAEVQFNSSNGDVETAASHFPDQLLFVHMGQQHISEIQFHPQIHGVLVSTACDGFNFFKPCNI